jgi:superfamily II DNA or RNA helicase
MRPLRPHQSRAIDELRQALRSGSKRPMLQAPTGAGKTVLAAAIIDLARAKGSRVIFTVPAIELVDQTAREFYAEGIRDVGVIQSNHPMTDPSKPVQIASIQTLQRRRLPEADLVIVDEAHRAFSFIEEWMTRDEWIGVPFIGLSATPWTKGLGRLYDRLIIAATTAELIKAEYLSKFRVFAPSHPDLSGVRTVAGDYHEGDLSGVMSDKTLVADVVSTWLAKAEGRPTLCFAVDRTHAKTLQAQFQARGVPCGYVDATTPRDERERVRKAFASGEYRVVCNVGVLTTGVDWDVRCIVLARPTKSEILYTQIIGRGLRTADGKDNCLILDHSDTTLRLGFVTDIHHERLDGGPMSEAAGETKERAAPKPKECPRCHYVRAPGLASCPSCGHVTERVSGVETVEGELVDLSERRKANRDEGWSGKVAFIAQLRAHALVTGKSDGWVAHKYRAKFGVWPNDRRVKLARPAASVSPEVASWIKSQAIRYAKSRERARVSA